MIASERKAVDKITDYASHVPPHLKVAFDFADGPEIYAFPPTAAEAYRRETPTFYSTFYGGFWLFTRYEDVRAVFQDWELFAPDPGVPHYSEHRFVPLHLSPPDHTTYRRIEAPIFAPARMRQLEPRVRELTRRALEKVRGKHEIDLVSEFSLETPAAMFCAMLDLPSDQYPRFRALADDLFYGAQHALKSGGPEAARQVRDGALAAISAILTEAIASRRAAPGNDVIGDLIRSTVNGRPLSDEELLNMTTFLFFAGTDSTAGAINFSVAFLATHPAAKQAFIDHLDDADYLWNASEELLRLHGFHHLSRRVTRDAEFAGVTLRAGDLVMLPTGIANRDPEKSPNPDDADFERANAKTHLTFGAGIHRCSGSHLATLQLRVALEALHRTMPDYRLAEPVVYASGGQKAAPALVRIAFGGQA